MVRKGRNLDHPMRLKIFKLTVIAAVIIIISSFIVIQVVQTSSNSPSMLINKIVGNASDPQVSDQFPGANISTNLWNLESGKGNTTISVYSNNSIHIVSNYTNVVTKSANVVGYPSARFRYGLPITVSDAIKDNISSTVTFNLANTSDNLPVDLSYDIMIQPSKTVFSPLVEIMIYLYYAPYLVNYVYLGQFKTVSMINETSVNITWIVEEGKSATNGAPLVRFFPEAQIYSRMSYLLNLSSFISETQSILKMNLSTNYIQQINIGMEFGFSSFSHYSFSLWLSATLFIKGTKVGILRVT